MKRKTLLSLVCITAILLILTERNHAAVPLLDAIKNKSIQVDIKSNGDKHGNSHIGKCLNFTIKNLSTYKNLSVSLNAGLKLACENPGLQDMIITENQIFALAPGQTRSYDVCGMCIEKSNGGPRAEVRYKTNGFAKSPLLDLTDLIAQKGYQTTAGQAAVWVITDKASPDAISSENKKEMKELRDFVYNIASTPDFREYCISGEFVCNRFSGEKVSVIAYDSNHKQIRVIAENLSIAEHQNFYAFKLTAPYIRRNGNYYVRMISSRGDYLELSVDALPN